MKSFIASVAVSLAAFLSLAATYPVTDYSWLQLPEGITPSAGNPSNPVVTSGWTSHGSIDYIRGSMWVWIANTDLTGKGAYDFWGAVHMDPPRNVKKINATLWGQAGSTWRRFKVEGSIDGETFTQIGEYDAGDWRNDHWTQIKGLEVTNGTYKAIRLRFNGTDSQPDDPDYVWDNAGYGGPGITMLEPIGDGELSAEEVNFVNGPNFNTTCINNVDWNAGQKFNTGTLDDSQMVGERIDAAGNGWDEGHYMQVDLGQERRIYRSALAFCQGYSCNGFSFAYSTDGETWHDIVDPVGPTFRFANSIIDYNFQPVTARYWRITGATGGNQYALISQWML